MRLGRFPRRFFTLGWILSGLNCIGHAKWLAAHKRLPQVQPCTNQKTCTIVQSAVSMSHPLNNRYNHATGQTHFPREYQMSSYQFAVRAHKSRICSVRSSSMSVRHRDVHSLPETRNDKQTQVRKQIIKKRMNGCLRQGDNKRDKRQTQLVALGYGKNGYIDRLILTEFNVTTRIGDTRADALEYTKSAVNGINRC